MLSLPPEIISIITVFLPHEDQLAFSLVASSARQHVLTSLFSDFRMGKYGEDLGEVHDNLKGAGQEFKRAIRQVTPRI